MTAIDIAAVVAQSIVGFEAGGSVGWVAFPPPIPVLQIMPSAAGVEGHPDRQSVGWILMMVIIAWGKKGCIFSRRRQSNLNDLYGGTHKFSLLTPLEYFGMYVTHPADPTPGAR